MINNHASTSHQTETQGQPQLTIGGQSLLFMMLPVTVHYKGKSVKTHAFLDYGSAFTLIDNSLAEELELVGTPEPLTMVCAKGMIAREDNSLITSFKISGSSNTKCYNIREARTVKNLKLPKGSQDAIKLKELYPHLKGLPLPSFQGVTPKILIGVDNCNLISYNNVVEKHGEIPIAVKTKLGWCVFGKAKSEQNSVGLTFLINQNTKEDVTLHELVKSFFTTESFGVKPMTNTRKSAEEERVEQIVNKSPQETSDGKRYQVGLLWKSDDTVLPDSYSMAYKRLLYVEHKMKNDVDLNSWYINIPI
jgi:hypothetical protein